MPIESLPTELFGAILEHVALADRQATTLGLSRALPHSAIPLHYLFNCITLRTRTQVLLLMKKIVLGGAMGAEVAAWVQHFAFRGWNVDPDVLNK